MTDGGGSRNFTDGGGLNGFTDGGEKDDNTDDETDGGEVGSFTDGGGSRDFTDGGETYGFANLVMDGAVDGEMDEVTGGEGDCEKFIDGDFNVTSDEADIGYSSVTSCFNNFECSANLVRGKLSRR